MAILEVHLGSACLSKIGKLRRLYVVNDKPEVCAQVCTAMGCSAGFASAPISGRNLQRAAIQGSVSLALRLGQAVLDARSCKQDPVAAVALAGRGKVMFQGD